MAAEREKAAKNKIKSKRKRRKISLRRPDYVPYYHSLKLSKKKPVKPNRNAANADKNSIKTRSIPVKPSRCRSNSIKPNKNLVQPSTAHETLINTRLNLGNRV